MSINLKSTFALTTFLFTLSNSDQVFAGCGQGTPAKHQMLVVWNGVNDMGDGQAIGAFDIPVHYASENYGSKGHKQWLALGGSIRPEDGGKKEFVPATRPDAQFMQNAKVMDASPEGLQKIAKEINAEFDDLRRRDKNLRPEDVQVIFMVTNHGTLNTGKNGKTFGIAANPLAKTKTTSKMGSPQITQDEVTEFAKALPQGIRTKAIFGQCYGANLMESYLKGLQAGNRCACGVAAADINAESWGADWDYDIMRNSLGTSLANGFNKNRFSDEQNLNTASSEAFLYRYFINKTQDLGIQADNGDDILKNSHLILEKMQSQKKILSQDERDLLDEASRFHELGYYEWIRKEDISKTKDLLSYSGLQSLKGEKSENFDKKYAAVKDPILDDLRKINASYRILPRLEQDHSREEILKAFLLSASTEEKNTFRDLAKCEQDPLQGQSAVTESKSSSADEAKKSNTGVK